MEIFRKGARKEIEPAVKHVRKRNPQTLVLWDTCIFPFTVTEKSMLRTKLRHQRPTAYLTCIEPHCGV